MTKFVHILCFLFLYYSTCLYAHGEGFAIQEGPKGPVVLSATQIQALMLKTAQVTKRPLAKTLMANGQIQLLPNAQADVSVRISGSVTAIEANLGDRVKKGQRLAVIQSRLIGDPPPSISVVSPINGMIDARNITLGQAVEPNTVLFHLSNRDRLLAIVKIYEEDLGKVKLGQAVNVYALSYPKQIFKGSISLIEPNLDALTRTVNAQVNLNNTDNLLKPGMFVRAEILLNQEEGVLTVPNEAILVAGKDNLVFLRQGNTFIPIQVHPGASNAQFTEIDTLKPGDVIVTQGVRQLYTMWLSGGKTMKSGG